MDKSEIMRLLLALVDQLGGQYAPLDMGEDSHLIYHPDPNWAKACDLLESEGYIQKEEMGDYPGCYRIKKRGND